MDANSFRLDEDGAYRCVAFDQFTWQRHSFGTRQHCGRADVLLRQIHSASVIKVDASRVDDDTEGDALVTDCPGLSIGVKTADCVPLLLLDRRKRATAAVHAGWRGTAAGIVRAVVHKLEEAFGTQASDLYAAIGPCIQACCYEVGADVADRFGIATDDGKTHLDLTALNRRQLLEAGLPCSRISASGLCTSCHPELFFSYRRNPGERGRMISVIERLH